MIRLRQHLLSVVALFVGLGLSSAAAQEATEFTTEQIEFFETHVRPVLAEHCYECHSAESEKIKGGLKLDSRDDAIKGGDSGAGMIPGQPDQSLIIDAIRWKSLEMPPKGKLRTEQVDALTRWVESGAAWPPEKSPGPSSEPTSYDWPTLQAEHWSFRAIKRPATPQLADQSRIRNEIDAFVFSDLQTAGIQPNPMADARTIVRRLYYDLIGLPPEPSQVEAFLVAAETDRDVAVAELVDELLESPHYGERWGRHWLDVARYSDGFGGFLDGAAMPNAWRYRDWVVNALNQDLPIDQFLKMQIAGDLLLPPQPVATGFLALGPTYISDGGDPDATAQARSETLDDRVDTVTRGLLGLTASCARCHDHKFDPIPQLDYYSLAGVFNNTQLKDLPLVPDETVQAFNQHQEHVRSLEKQIAARIESAKAENRALTESERQQQSNDEARLKELKAIAPAAYPVAHTIADSGAADMHLAIRGNLRKPGPIAPRRFLHILSDVDPPLFQHGSGRLELAEAIVSRNNPLTARVLVNRIWLQHFGQGLVRTPSNFGKLGEPPTHPELLDWLAAEFMEPSQSPGHQHGTAWSLKNLHRLILNSSTWQMSTAMNEAAFAVDGDNRKLWRMNPRRLDVESWRDSLLAVTGELDRTLGGESIGQLLNSPRRTLYAAVSRNGDRYASDTFLRLFDFPLPRATSEGRTSSVVPQQSLFLMNSPFMMDRAKALAARLHRDCADDAARVQRAYVLLYARSPTEEELQLGLDFVQTPTVANDKVTLTGWEQYAQVLLSANELMHY